uniref:hypothetical protein n=1 Tax=Mariniflexile sp. TaxID=1979402 RepID=UPI0040471BCE
MLNNPLKYTDFSGETYNGDGLTSGEQTGIGAAIATVLSSINWKGIRFNDIDDWTTKHIFRSIQSVGDWIGGCFKKRSSGDKPIGTNFYNFFNNSMQQGTVFTTNVFGIAITNSATFGIVQPNRAFEGTDFELAERLGRFTGDMLSFGGGVSLDVGAAGLELVTVGG